MNGRAFVFTGVQQPPSAAPRSVSWSSNAGSNAVSIVMHGPDSLRLSEARVHRLSKA